MHAWLARCDLMVDLTAIMETNYIHLSTMYCTYIQAALSLCGEQEPSRQPLRPSGEHLAGPRLGEVGLSVK